MQGMGNFKLRSKHRTVNEYMFREEVFLTALPILLIVLIYYNFASGSDYISFNALLDQIVSASFRVAKMILVF
jgi:hypothetical protein